MRENAARAHRGALSVPKIDMPGDGKGRRSEVINLAGIPQFTGDFDQLDKDVSALRSDAIGIRDGGSDVHSRFQMLEAFYPHPRLRHCSPPLSR
ncbi:hypothetical protein LV779_06495 [Streptomyces thinghirensis]|nr:hypothetical protein [Streptomyces thinghirensis]